MGLTIAEKILARASGKNSVKPGQYVTATVDLAMVHDSMGPISEILSRVGVERLWDGEKVVCLLDHWNPPSTVRDAEMYKQIRSAVKKFNIKHFYGQNAGICHQVLFEKGHILPGRLSVGSGCHSLIPCACGGGGGVGC